MKKVKSFSIRNNWLSYAPSILIFLSFQQTFAAKLKCESLSFPQQSHKVNEVVSKAMAEAQLEKIRVQSKQGQQVFQSIKNESKLDRTSPEERALAEINRTVALRLAEYKEAEARREAEAPKNPFKGTKFEHLVEEAPLFNVLAPTLFMENFTPLLDARWQSLRESDMVLKNLKEVWNFLSAREQQFNREDFEKGSHLLSHGQTKLIEILREKLKTATSEKQLESEEISVETLRLLNHGLGAQHMLAQIGQVGRASDVYLFEILELRAKYRLRILEQGRVKEKDDFVLKDYETALRKISLDFKNPSVAFQEYLLKSQGILPYFLMLVVHSDVKLIDSFNEIILRKMAEKVSIEDSLKMAEYLIKVGLYQSQVSSFLLEAANTPHLDAQLQAQIQKLLSDLGK